jgi:membrane associated rhomboid family serine protease
MLIPIKHENMSARRWPVITFALIAINVVVFLATLGPLQDEQKQIAPTKLHLILLAATHPELKVPADSQDVVRSLKDRYPKQWAQLNTRKRRAWDDWDARMLQMDDPEVLQSEMNNLSADLQKARADSILEKYAYVPVHPTAISYLTANFLHGGWMHLIGNMWFLWLAGFVLEDFWGRPLYTAFYLISGAASMMLDGLFNSGSITPTLGASGAIAALMGAFLVRFPKMKIEMLWWIFLRPRRFKAPAYYLLPGWLALEVFYGSVFGQSTGVAHWAHVGGFAFGALTALTLRYTGLEQKAHEKVEAELTLQSGPEIQRANEFLDKGELLSAEEILNDYVSRNPDSIDAYMLLRTIYQKQNKQIAAAETLAKVCVLHLRAKENDLAWKCYEEFLAAGGQAPPAANWMELCRAAESLQHFDRAVAEYEKLIATYPADRQSIAAQLAAARICLKRLKQPERALQFFKAAEASPVPHLDWEQSIAAGIKEANAAQSQKSMAASATSQN